MTNLVVGNLWGFDGPRHAPWPDIMSSIIIYTAAFGILFYISTILASILRPDSPFQTPGSRVNVNYLQKFRPAQIDFYSWWCIH
jgi:hypothetical protein